jgi:hypothetical protein
MLAAHPSCGPIRTDMVMSQLLADLSLLNCSSHLLEASRVHACIALHVTKVDIIHIIHHDYLRRSSRVVVVFFPHQMTRKKKEEKKKRKKPM